MPQRKLNNQDIMVSKGWRAQLFQRLVYERPDFFEQVANYSMLGADDNQMAAFFHVERDTWLYWKKHSQKIQDAIDAGGSIADAEVAAAMKRRATGYDYTRQKLVVGKDGHGEVHDLTEHVPPDTAAGKFWLTNRSTKWSDRQTQEHTGARGGPIDQEITINFVGSKSQQTITARVIEEPANDAAGK